MEQGEWSWDLIYLTWNELRAYLLYREYTDRNFYMKRMVKGELQYAYILGGNYLSFEKENNDLKVIDSDGKNEWEYESVAEIIADGWVVD